ncbi:MAG: PIN domain-containing protein [Microbacteriaceae bacterium]|nr:PIN domain-containing protein [Microbacteriaceae bacterium]
MAWYFLRPDQSGEYALSQLNQLRTNLRNVPSGFAQEAVLAASRYMTWHETAESFLASLYRDADVPRRLQTDRYWHIRVISPTTERPYPLIEREVEEQQRYLEGLEKQLLHYQELLRPDPDEALFICDTNVLVHGLPFEQVRWNEEFTEKKARLLLPLVVIDELDALKDRGIREAGGVLKALDGVLAPGKALDRVTLRDNVTLQIVDEPVGHQRLVRIDDEIVQQAAFYTSMAGRKITLFTRDRGMRVRAETSVADLEGRMLPTKYERRHDFDTKA